MEYTSIEEKLGYMFLAAGLPVSGRGYTVLLAAVCLATENPDRLLNIGEGIYRPIAEKYQTSPENISKSIQRIRDCIWDSQRAIGYLQRAGCSVSCEYGKLPPRELIGMMRLLVGKP